MPIQGSAATILPFHILGGILALVSATWRSSDEGFNHASQGRNDLRVRDDRNVAYWRIDRAAACQHHIDRGRTHDVLHGGHGHAHSPAARHTRLANRSCRDDVRADRRCRLFRRRHPVHGTRPSRSLPAVHFWHRRIARCHRRPPGDAARRHSGITLHQATSLADVFRDVGGGRVVLLGSADSRAGGASHSGAAGRGRAAPHRGDGVLVVAATRQAIGSRHCSTTTQERQ